MTENYEILNQFTVVRIRVDTADPIIEIDIEIQVRRRGSVEQEVPLSFATLSGPVKPVR